jgi:hypothetical protein
MIMIDGWGYSNQKPIMIMKVRVMKVRVMEVRVMEVPAKLWIREAVGRAGRTEEEL